MPDDIQIAPIGTPYPVVTDELAGGRHVQVLKTGFGADGLLTFVEDAAPLPTTTRFALPTVPRLSVAGIVSAAAGFNLLLAGTPGQTIRLFRSWLVVSNDVAVNFCTGLNGLHPPLPLLANGAWVLDFDGEPWFTTLPGDALQINLSVAAQLSGVFYYTKS